MGTVRGNINGNIVLEIHNSTSKIQGLDKSQRSILSGVLACKVPGYYFMQRYRNGSWDGTQRFYNALTSELPTGIVPLAINWLEENGLDYRIDDQRTNRDLEFQDVSAELNGKTLRDDQKQVVSQVENSHVGKHDWKFQRGIINMATNGGKTVVAEALIQNLLPKLKKTKRVILFCTGSLEIYNQAVKSLTQDLGFAVGRIQGSTWNLRPVTVAMIPTLNSRIKRADHLYTKLQEVCAGFIVDECLSKNSQVLLPGGITKTIEEVCNDDSITEVISYNHELNIFEPKRILRKIVTPGREQFWKVYFENPVTKKEGFLVCTKNHKIWSSAQGYVPLEQLNVGDTVKIHTGEKRQVNRIVDGKYYCERCGRVFETPAAYGGHNGVCGVPEETRKKNDEKRLATWLKNHPDRKVNIPEAARKEASRRMKEYNALPEVKERSSIRCKTLLKTPEIRKKRGESVRKYLATHPEAREKQLKRFKNAPLYNREHITRLEQFVIDLEIPGLDYTGDGSYWVTFQEGRYKNPDFVYNNGVDKKVVEVGDIEYWHNEKEIQETIESYQKIGYQCLYLTSKEIWETPEIAVGKIEKFLFNHNVKITKISKAIGLIPEFKYNLEVEDNHNYIANDLLVSNCHHSSSSTWYNTLMTLDNAFVRIGLSGTVADITKCKADKKLNAMRLNAISGAILAKVSNQQLITSQVSAKPLCYFATIDKPKLDKVTYGVSSGVLGDLNYKDSYKLGIVNNNYRNWVVANICNSEVKATKAQCLVLIEFIEHGVNLLQMFEEFFPELNVVFLNGALAAEDRLRGLEMLKQGIADVVIATSILDEGVDVPSINALVYARAGKSDRKLLQGIGRGLRKKADGSTVRVYDFIDDTCKYLLIHSLERFKVLKGEDFSIKTLKLEDINCGETEFQKLFESGDMKVVDIPDTLSVSE